MQVYAKYCSKQKLNLYLSLYLIKYGNWHSLEYLQQLDYGYVSLFNFLCFLHFPQRWKTFRYYPMKPLFGEESKSEKLEVYTYKIYTRLALQYLWITHAFRKISISALFQSCTHFLYGRYQTVGCGWIIPICTSA